MENDENTQVSDRSHLALEFGEYIKNLRINAGYSIDRVSSATKIGKDFIEALELGQVDKLPGRVFARGFIRSLCRNYQVPVDDVLEKFEEAFGQESNAVESSATVLQADKETDTRKILGKIEKKVWLSEKIENLPLSRYFHTIPLLTMGVVSISLIMVIFYLTEGPVVQDQTAGKSERAKIIAEAERQPAAGEAIDSELAEGTDGETDVATAPTQEQVVQQQINETSVPISSDNKSESVAATEPAKGASATDQQSLKLDVKSAVKVKIAFDKGSYEIMQLEPGEHKFEFKDEAKVLIYDAGALNVSFNGKDLGDLGKPGRIRRLSFKKESPTKVF
ncbi:MAG: helix-turn-helix domain-containing protein [Oligoflexales bacterium]